MVDTISGAAEQITGSVKDQAGDWVFAKLTYLERVQGGLSPARRGRRQFEDGTAAEAIVAAQVAALVGGAVEISRSVQNHSRHGQGAISSSSEAVENRL